MSGVEDWFEAARSDNVQFIQEHMSMYFSERNKKRLEFTALLTAAHYENVETFSALLQYEIGLCTTIPFSIAVLTSRGYTCAKIHPNTSIAQYCVYRNFYAGADLCLQMMQEDRFSVLRGSFDGAGKSTLTVLLEMGTPECMVLLRRHFNYFAQYELVNVPLDPLELSLVFGRPTAVELLVNALKYCHRYTHEKLVEHIIAAMRVRPIIYGLFENENFATTDEIHCIKVILEKIIERGEIKRIDFVKNKRILGKEEILAMLKSDMLDARENKQFPTDLAAQSSRSYVEFLKAEDMGDSDNDDSYYEEEEE